MKIAESQLKEYQARQGAAPESPERIKALRNQNSVEPAAQRNAKTIAAQEPVTARILRKTQNTED